MVSTFVTNHDGYDLFLVLAATDTAGLPIGYYLVTCSDDNEANSDCTSAMIVQLLDTIMSFHTYLGVITIDKDQVQIWVV